MVSTPSATTSRSRARQVYNGAHESPALGASPEPADERAVHLQDVHGKTLEVGEIWPPPLRFLLPGSGGFAGNRRAGRSTRAHRGGPGAGRGAMPENTWDPSHQT